MLEKRKGAGRRRKGCELSRRKSWGGGSLLPRGRYRASSDSRLITPRIPVYTAVLSITDTVNCGSLAVVELKKQVCELELKLTLPSLLPPSLPSFQPPSSLRQLHHRQAMEILLSVSVLPSPLLPFLYSQSSPSTFPSRLSQRTIGTRPHPHLSHARLRTNRTGRARKHFNRSPVHGECDLRRDLRISDQGRGGEDEVGEDESRVDLLVEARWS